MFSEKFLGKKPIKMGQKQSLLILFYSPAPSIYFKMFLHSQTASIYDNQNIFCKIHFKNGYQLIDLQQKKTEMDQKTLIEEIQTQSLFKLTSPRSTTQCRNLDDYISQFLDLSNGQQNQQYSSQVNPIKNNSLISLKHEGKVEIQSEYSQGYDTQPVKTIPKKSIFHNLQKHLAIALRNTIDIPKEQLNNSLTKKMWKIFMDSQNFTKNSLYILFGNYDEADQETENLFYKYGFGSLIEKYSARSIQEAQKNLRALVCQQFKIVSIKQYVQKTRVKNKQQFYAYLLSFLKQISTGPIKHRLSRNKSLQLTQRVLEKSKTKREPLKIVIGSL